MINPSLYSSKSDEWETPPELFAKLDAVFHFDLDPCATDANHKCERYFTKEQDGLAQHWWGSESVFINPPYSQIDKWVEKAWGLATCSRIVVLLIPSRTDTRWFQDYAPMATAIYFIKGRVKFVGGNASAPFPSMVVVFGGSHAKTPEIPGMLRMRP